MVAKIQWPWWSAGDVAKPEACSQNAGVSPVAYVLSALRQAATQEHSSEARKSWEATAT